MLSISIVTYNSEKVIRKTLDSIIEHQPKDQLKQLFLVDNNSTDQTTSILSQYAKRHKNIDLIQNIRNVGYGSGHNVAIKKANSKYHVICNPDIIIHNNLFTPMAEFMDQNQEVAILCPKFQYINGECQPLNRRYPTVFDLFLRRLESLQAIPAFKKRVNYYSMIDIGYDDICDVPFVSGAFMFCRTTALKQVSGFDERFFLYFEDADLSRKMQQKGYRTICYPYTVVSHRYERASNKELKMMMIFLKSAIKYFNKWGYKLF